MPGERSTDISAELFRSLHILVAHRHYFFMSTRCWIAREWENLGAIISSHLISLPLSAGHLRGKYTEEMLENDQSLSLLLGNM